jgi:CubicO group peptidase (beta-lactamase class C family)
MSGRFSSARLARMQRVMSGHVESGKVPGLVTVLSRRGELQVEALGTKTLGGREPMQRDSLFRISSMTKPLTAVAALILLEECRLRLDEPVDRLLPELAQRKVLRRIDSPLDDTVPAQRPITVRDLLTFRMGLGMIWGPPGLYPIQQAIAELGILGFGPPQQSSPHDGDEWLRRLGTLPLMHQPGERWMYNTGSSVLGVLIARASGQPLESFMRERIFEPLGMKDTAFSVPPDKIERLPTQYWPDQQSGAMNIHDGVRDSAWARPPAFADGGAGLVSTADDYLAFATMLLNGGSLGRQRILARPTVELMRSDQLTPAQKAASAWFPGQWDHRGWGLGVSVVTGRDDFSATPGRYGWDGGFGTTWWNDPQEQMVAMLFTQCMVFPLFSAVYLDFWTSAYQAIDD